MPDQRYGDRSTAWRADLNAMIRTSSTAALERYAIFSPRSIPARASAQMWILALATAGLLMLFPLIAGNVVVGWLRADSQNQVRDWSRVAPMHADSLSLRVPAHLRRFAAGGQRDDRIVFGLQLAEILRNLPDGSSRGFPERALDHEVTIAFFSPGEAVFELGAFVRLYGRYLEGSKTVGPDGLTVQRFVGGGPFDDEILMFETGYSRDRYFVRCYSGEAGDELDTCFRRVRISDGLALRYAFDRDLIGHWVALEAAVVALALKMAEAPRRAR
jgi:hypothetical protein